MAVGVERFVSSNESARKSVTILERLGQALNKQQMELLIADCEQHHVDSYKKLRHFQVTTKLAFSGATRMLAIAPELKSRRSTSIPSEKITPPVGIWDSSASGAFAPANVPNWAK